MPSAIYVAYTRPTSASQDEEYNRWLDTVHLPDVVGAVPGIVGARRYKLNPKQFRPGNGDEYEYLTIYEIEADIDATFADLAAARDRGDLPLSKALEVDPPPSTAVYVLQSEYRP